MIHAQHDFTIPLQFLYLYNFYTFTTLPSSAFSNAIKLCKVTVAPMVQLPADVDFISYCNKYGINLRLFPESELHGLYNNFRRDKGLSFVTCRTAWEILTQKYKIIDIPWERFTQYCNEISHLNHWVYGAG